jgi:protein-disulfide isomerase
MENKPTHVGKPTHGITEQDHVQGTDGASVTLIEYGDFECPFSREAVQTVKALQQQCKEHLRFVFRHFPLLGRHPHALAAAEAAEAAAAQGQFWAMYGLLFANQWELEQSDLMAYAERLGLDRKAFRQALTEHRFIERIRTDLLNGQQHDVTGTPTFFINGRLHDGEDGVPGLLAAIRQALPNR